MVIGCWKKQKREGKEGGVGNGFTEISLMYLPSLHMAPKVSKSLDPNKALGRDSLIWRDIRRLSRYTYCKIILTESKRESNVSRLPTVRYLTYRYIKDKSEFGSE